MFVTVILAQKNKKKQVISMILALQSFLFILNLIRYDTPRPLLTVQHPGSYMLLTIVTNTPVYILFCVFTAWFYKKLLEPILKKPLTGRRDSSRRR